MPAVAAATTSALAIALEADGGAYHACGETIASREAGESTAATQRPASRLQWPADAFTQCDGLASERPASAILVRPGHVAGGGVQ